MYLAGSLAFDPSQITVIKKVQPKKMFAKFLDAITFGQSSEKLEHETFTAVAILQQLNMGLRSMGIKNVVRIAMDDHDFYLDEKGKDDDMTDAMFEFEAKVDPIESETFNTLYLVLEHLEGSLKYIIEISISKKHKVGEYPIQIKTNAVMSELQLKPGETRDDMQNRMKMIFTDQIAYDNYLHARKLEFDQFLDRLEMSVRKFVKVDDTHKISNVKIIRPSEKVDSPNQIRNNQSSDPVFYGYYGFGDYFFYSWMWSSMLFHSGLYVNNFHMVDSYGQDVMSVGDQGFNAAEGDTFNEDADFAPPTDGDVSFGEGGEYADQIETSDMGGDFAGDAADSSGGGFFDSFMGDSDSGSSCSSCSSCGGCGGCD
jgi:hypothetical protein